MSSQRLWLVVGYSYAGTGGVIQSTWAVGRFKEYSRATAVAKLLGAWVGAQGLGLRAAARVSPEKYRYLVEQFCNLTGDRKLDTFAFPNPGGIAYRVWELPRGHHTDDLSDDDLREKINAWSVKAEAVQLALDAEFPDDTTSDIDMSMDDESFPDESG